MWFKDSGRESKAAAVVPPEELFAQASPSVVVVEAFDRGGRELVCHGSGVVTDTEHVVTNKHVVEKGIAIRVRHQGTYCPARITHQHPEHDLCRLAVAGLKAPAAPVRDLSHITIGQRVYAIGSPLGFDLTFSEGLISGLRRHKGETVIQTTAPISEGSSGGGLFDNEAKLLGIITYFIVGGQNLNFALPATLILTLERHPSQERLATPQAAAARLDPAGMIKARLEMEFPQCAFEVASDTEQVVHVTWHGLPPGAQVRECLRSLILRREIPNPEFEFEWREQ